MYGRNQNRYMNNGGQSRLGNRQQGYGLQQLNQRPEPNQNAYDNASPNARFNQIQPQIQRPGWDQQPKPLPYQSQNKQMEYGAPVRPPVQGMQPYNQPAQQPQMQQYQNNGVSTSYPQQPIQAPAQNPMYRNQSRDRYINDDRRRRLQQMMLQRRMGRGGRFGGMAGIGRYR